MAGVYGGGLRVLRGGVIVGVVGDAEEIVIDVSVDGRLYRLTIVPVKDYVCDSGEDSYDCAEAYLD